MCEMSTVRYSQMVCSMIISPIVGYVQFDIGVITYPVSQSMKAGFNVPNSHFWWHNCCGFPAFKCWCQAAGQYSLDFPSHSFLDGDILWAQYSVLFYFSSAPILQSLKCTKCFLWCRSFLNSAFELLLRAWATSRDFKVCLNFFSFLFLCSFLHYFLFFFCFVTTILLLDVFPLFIYVFSWILFFKLEQIDNIMAF